MLADLLTITQKENAEPGSCNFGSLNFLIQPAH